MPFFNVLFNTEGPLSGISKQWVSPWLNDVCVPCFQLPLILSVHSTAWKGSLFRITGLDVPRWIPPLSTAVCVYACVRMCVCVLYFTAFKMVRVYLCVPPTSMGVRVMDTSWVARRGPSIVRKASSTPPAMQPPAPPCELAATPQSPIPEQSLDISATPSPTPTSFGFPPGVERAR